MVDWFTADTHFGHKRTMELSKRPFELVEEMDFTMIRNWNRVVKDDDRVFHLGDFGNYEVSQHLKGKIITFMQLMITNFLCCLHQKYI